MNSTELSWAGQETGAVDSHCHHLWLAHELVQGDTPVDGPTSVFLATVSTETDTRERHQRELGTRSTEYPEQDFGAALLLFEGVLTRVSDERVIGETASSPCGQMHDPRDNDDCSRPVPPRRSSELGPRNKLVQEDRTFRWHPIPATHGILGHHCWMEKCLRGV